MEHILNMLISFDMLLIVRLQSYVVTMSRAVGYNTPPLTEVTYQDQVANNVQQFMPCRLVGITQVQGYSDNLRSSPQYYPS